MNGPETTTLSLVMMLVFLRLSHGFLHLPEGRSFLRSYCNALHYNSVNIFLANSDTNDGLSVSVLRSLWVDNIRSVSVRRVSDVTQIAKVLEDDPSTSINVGFLQQPHDVPLFVEMASHSVVRKYPWLIFGDIRDFLSETDDIYLILDNQIAFASLMNTSATRIEILEAYNIAPGLPATIEDLGQWTEGTRVKMPKESWIQRRSNLTGLHLRCATLEQKPFVTLSEPDSQGNVNIIEGYAGDAWHVLQDMLGFTYSCHQPADNQWGSVNSEGAWNGLVKELLDGKADIVVTALDQNNARVRAVDFLEGLREVGYQLVTRRPGLMEQTWTSFTSELVPASWMATIAFAILVPPCLSLCAYFSPSEPEKISLKDAYILTIGAFTTQGSWLEVKSLPTRIVFITIFFATLIVYAHYTSALVSLLTVAATSSDINGLQSLLKDGSYKFGFQRGTSIQEEFETASSGLFYDVWHQLVSADPANLPEVDEHGINKVVGGNYVHMTEENLYRATYANNCKTMMIKGKYFSKQTGFAVAKGSPLQEIFNAQLMRMRDGGVLSRLWEYWQPTPPLCTLDRVVALDIQQVFTAFLLLILGIALAFIFLPCERIHWNTVGKDRTFRKVLQTLPKKKIISETNHSTPVASWYPRMNTNTTSSSSPVSDLRLSRNIFGKSDHFD